MTSCFREHVARTWLRFPGAVVVAAIGLLLVVCSSDPGGWRTVLDFDVLDEAPRKSADLDDGNVLVALRDPALGWDVGVYRRPFREDSENLLYGGMNLHGVQPWFVLAWTKHDRIYPDVREIAYGSPPRRIRIDLAGCDTKKEGKKSLFTRGTLRISWRP